METPQLLTNKTRLYIDILMVEIKVALKIEGLKITLYQGYSVYTKFSPLKPDLGILFVFTWIQ